jgi:hypothetical protein
VSIQSGIVLAFVYFSITLFRWATADPL